MSEAADDAPSISSVNFGTANTFTAPIGDIAGRDIHKPTYNFSGNVYGFSFFNNAEILHAERALATQILDHYSWLRDFFVPPRLTSFQETAVVSLPHGFKGDFSPELSLLLSANQTSLYTQRQATAVTLESILDGPSVYLAAPLGYGKTTLLQMLSLEASQRFLAGVESGVAGEHHNDTHIAMGLRLPVYVDLSFYGRGQSFTDFVKEYGWYDGRVESINWHGTLVPSLLELYLESGKMLVLLDSLDAVGVQSMPDVKALIRRFIKDHPRNVFVVAGRENTFDPNLDLLHVSIEEWDNQQIEVFLQKRFGSTEGSRLLSRLRTERPQLAAWLKTPYIAYATALYYKEHGQIPSEVSDVSDRLISALLQRDVLRGTLTEDESAEVDVFASAVATATIQHDKGLEFDHQLASNVADVIKGDVAELTSKCVLRGLVVTNRDGSGFSFRNRLVENCLVGRGLKRQYQLDPDRFSELLSDDNTQRALQRLKRSPLFRKPVSSDEIAWDRMLPPLEPSKWLDGLFMALATTPDEQIEDILHTVLSSSPVTAGHVMALLQPDLGSTIATRIKDHLAQIGDERNAPLRLRLVALGLLGTIGDPRLSDNNMRSIPYGKAKLGSKAIDEYTHVEPFSLDTYLVTNAQFERFCQNGGYSNRRYWTAAGWDWLRTNGIVEPGFWRDVRFNVPNHPVVGVSWFEAYAYSQWLGKRLPTEEEWERAATWDPSADQVRRFPTGNEMFEGIGNLLIKEYEYVYCTTPVGAYPLGRSQDGVYDLVGNAWEWLSTKFEPTIRKADRSCEQPDGVVPRCLRGGSWGLDQVPGAACLTRHRENPSTRSPLVGFRCAT